MAETLRPESKETDLQTPKLIEILTPTETDFARLIHISGKIQNDDYALLMEYVTPATSERGKGGDEFIKILYKEFNDEILPWFENEMQNLTNTPQRTGETTFQNIQEQLIRVAQTPYASDRRRLTGILIGLEEVRSEFESRIPNLSTEPLG